MPVATLSAPSRSTASARERALERRVAELEAELAATKREASARERVLEARVAGLEAELAATRKDRDQWRAKYEQLAEKFVVIEQRRTELEARLRENSTNSNRPPSADPPGVKRPQRSREKTGRKRGAQPGHQGATRPLVPPDQVDRVLDVFPAKCARCERPAAARSGPSDPEPQRHQVTELPPVKPLVTEHRLHATTCRHCGEVTRAELPADVPRGAFGTKLQATVSLLTGRFRLSRREAVEALQALFGVEVSLGSITALEQATSDALAKPYGEALKSVREAGIIHADETGWRQAAARAWLWIAVTTTLSVFWIDPRRNRAAFVRFLGKFTGLLVSDRWGPYMKHKLKRHQLCWAHLKRDFEKLVLRGGDAKILGELLLTEVKAIFALWHRFERGEIDRGSLKRQLKPTQARVFDLLVDGLENSNAKANGLCARLVPVWTCLWVFTEIDGVEPTNNHGERELRRAVLWRKGSFGSQSNGGSLYVSRMLTTVASLRKQNRPVLAFLEQAIRAHREGTATPSLLSA